ncbi:hypothetical protein [Streptomyces griseosporeus]|uniref:hypothetical protein n=1 Tax=Streptomyces griseosporeus TaxID=1910 RepID=UPI0036FA8DF9
MAVAIASALGLATALLGARQSTPPAIAAALGCVNGGVRGAFQHPEACLQLGVVALILESLLRLGSVAALIRAHRIPMALPAGSGATTPLA